MQQLHFSGESNSKTQSQRKASMTKGRDTLSHIDGTQYELWMPGALGIKGHTTKPQELDTSKVVPVVDVTQGGFANESDQSNVTNLNVSLAGVTSLLTHPGISCRFSTGGGPANAAANESPFHARVTRASANVFFTAAGLAGLANRYMLIQFGLTLDSGAQMWLFQRLHFLWDKTAEYEANLDGMLINPGSEFVVRAYLLPAYNGGAGGATFPAGTTISIWTQSYKKPLGGQLPR